MSSPQPLSENLSQLSLLFEVSQILDRTLDLKEVTSSVLYHVASNLALVRGTITLLNRQTGEIFIEASYGLTPAEQKRGRYKLGEGITGKVVQSGEAAIVPSIAEEPNFLNRTGARKTELEKELAFLCIPIKQGSEVLGAFSADVNASRREVLDADVQVITIVCSMIAQAVRLRQEMEEEKQSLVEENTRLKSVLKESFQPSNIIGKSHAMRALYDLLAQVSQSDTTVLIRGESGTGKEMVAQALHYTSPRSDKPFVKVNCAALPEAVIESELFGHEKGAFTGAIATRKGRFEMADTGTIFLDEIGDLSPSMQVKLLRVLQEREIERVGGNRTIKIDVRIVTATNRNLEELLQAGTFREDLYYRLNVFPLHIPPLRERKSDILLLADYFIEKYNKKNRKNVKRIATSAINLLMAYRWPGNVRELENVIERAVLLASNDVILGIHLPPTLQTAESTGTQPTGTLQETLDRVERELILDALKSTKGNYSKTAKSLGITERIMGLRIKKYNLDKEFLRDFM
ncbi:MAG: sigma 54-interacting transcriptional regulator [Spirochaetales bacterium]|nr:sigma 54-interacting transcriptional regulator [Spirochaetales bacterium]